MPCLVLHKLMLQAVIGSLLWTASDAVLRLVKAAMHLTFWHVNEMAFLLSPGLVPF